MNISIFGLGSVGTVCAACLAERGHKVIAIDKSETKVRLVESGRAPVVEPDIDVLVDRAVNSGRLTATKSVKEAIIGSDVSIVCVGTPSQANGEPNLNDVERVACEIGHAIRAKKSEHTIIIRSTVPPGTTRNILLPHLAESSANASIRVAVNPAFLRQGSSVSDFNSPAKTIVGSLEGNTIGTVMSLYQDLPGHKFATDLETAELIKYVDNAWHALKIAFANEIGATAKKIGINSRKLMDLFVQDGQLNTSSAYLRPGFAFGGSCLPKDLQALISLAHGVGLSVPVLSHILESNRMLIEKSVEWICSQGRRRIGFLGISFKSSTDDVRESPFVQLVERLSSRGLEVKIFDPNVDLSTMIGANREYLMRIIPHVGHYMVTDPLELLQWAETLVVTTSDPRYEVIAAEAKSDQIVLDLSHVARSESTNAQGFLW